MTRFYPTTPLIDVSSIHKETISAFSRGTQQPVDPRVDLAAVSWLASRYIQEWLSAAELGTLAIIEVNTQSIVLEVTSRRERRYRFYLRLDTLHWSVRSMIPNPRLVQEATAATIAEMLAEVDSLRLSLLRK